MPSSTLKYGHLGNSTATDVVGAALQQYGYRVPVLYIIRSTKTRTDYMSKGNDGLVVESNRWANQHSERGQ